MKMWTTIKDGDGVGEDVGGAGEQDVVGAVPVFSTGSCDYIQTHTHTHTHTHLQSRE